MRQADHHMPLTRSQSHMWIGQELFPEAPLYNMALVFEIQGDIDPNAFRSAFQELINQADALRLVFETVDGIIKQNILPVLTYSLPVFDFSDAENPQDKILKWAKERSQRMFDLSTICFDAALIKLGPERYAWYLNQHHLITDAGAESLLYDALSKLYAQAVNGESFDIAPLHSYSAYVAYEQSIHQNPQKNPHLDYWKQQLQQLPTPHEWYGQRFHFRGTSTRRIRVDLGEVRSARLKKLATEGSFRSWSYHLSMYHLFASSLFSYLYRISGQNHLAIGALAHNRSSPEIRRTPGAMIELLPLAVHIEEGEHFRSLHQKVSKASFAFLKQAKAGAGDISLSRSFQAVLNYIPGGYADFAGLPIQSTWIHPGHCDPGHLMRLHVHDHDQTGIIQLHFDLNTDCFDEGLISAIPQHFLSVLDECLQDPDQMLDTLPLIKSADKEYQEQLFPESASSYGLSFQSVPELILEQCKRTPNQTALQHGGKELSYKQLNERADSLASKLHEQGVKTGDRVVLYLSRSFELIASILAVWKLGASYVPVPRSYPNQRISDMMADAQASLLICTEQHPPPNLKTEIPIVQLNSHDLHESKSFPDRPIGMNSPDSTAYIMYTSGSTGKPKGVQISHKSLGHYIRQAEKKYTQKRPIIAPLFTSIGFDLTVTSLFLPLTSGGKILIYHSNQQGPDLSLMDIVKENQVNFIKLTPSHLGLIRGMNLQESAIETMIVGGEDFKMELAREIQSTFSDRLEIFNEYGPTEATVGCIVHRYNSGKDQGISVPIGMPIDGMEAYILDAAHQIVPRGIAGELYLGGLGLADGYWQNPAETAGRFIPHPFKNGQRLYATGDWVRIKSDGNWDYLGRRDEQIKIGGIRIERGEIETLLAQHPSIESCVVDLHHRESESHPEEVRHCNRCGLPENYPGTTFDAEGICDLCTSFSQYQQKALQYFQPLPALKRLFDQKRKQQPGTYDCIMLLSGGKDSTYALARLVDMGLSVLAFTLDNGYISEQAKANIRRVVNSLEVDHIWGKSPVMNEIFVDSLKRHCNVCNGCFKTIYTLSMQVALEKNIPFIVTGLSRGQFFETRLTEELFRDEQVDFEHIDSLVLNARKAYHKVDDAVKRLMDVSMFENEQVFEQVQFIDFYRYCDAHLDEMMAYLDQHLPWIRPTDTGRSTNCLINQLGIYVHKKEKGYSNYAFPYSWDVRVGHKDREASLEEINEEIDEIEVKRIMKEIGYRDHADVPQSEAQLIAWYCAETNIPKAELKDFLSQSLPPYMVPTSFRRIPSIPISPNGKVDRRALKTKYHKEAAFQKTFEAPSNQIEEMVQGIWQEVLNLNSISVTESFLDLGGNSLAAIRIMARISEAFELELPLAEIFQYPSVRRLSGQIEKTIIELLEKMDSD